MNLAGAIKIIVCLLVFSVSILTWAVASAQRPSALVLEKSGATVPEVQPYSEIPSGATISLRDNARIVFVHYRQCQTVIVVGGTIKFGAETYAISGGKKESEKRTPCPKVVALKAGAETAGVLVRSGLTGVMLNFAPRPAFILVGKRADDFPSVRVIKDKKVLVEAPVQGRTFRWPSDAIPLPVETNYDLELVPAMSGAAPVKMSFFVSQAPEGTRAEEIILIRVD